MTEARARSLLRHNHHALQSQLLIHGPCPLPHIIHHIPYWCISQWRHRQRPGLHCLEQRRYWQRPRCQGDWKRAIQCLLLRLLRRPYNHNGLNDQHSNTIHRIAFPTSHHWLIFLAFASNGLFSFVWFAYNGVLCMPGNPEQDLGWVISSHS